MALRHLLMPCLLAAFALAGCADDPAATGDEGNPPDEPTGDADGQADTGDTVATGLVALPFSKDGTTYAGACGYTMVASQCTPTPGDGWLVVEADGPLRSVSGLVTWEPQADYELRLYLLTGGDGGWTWSDGDPVAASSTGTLEFDWDVTDYEAEEVLLSLNAYTGTGAMVAAAGISVPFDFHLEGEALSLAS